MFAAPSRLGLQPQDTVAGCGDASRIAGGTIWVLDGFLCWAHLFTEVRICSFLGSTPFSSFCLSSRENIAGIISIYLWTMSLYTVKTSLLPPQILRIAIGSRGDARPQKVIGPGCGKGQVASPPWRDEGRFPAATPGTVTSISHGTISPQFSYQAIQAVIPSQRRGLSGCFPA